MEGLERDRVIFFLFAVFFLFFSLSFFLFFGVGEGAELRVRDGSPRGGRVGGGAPGRGAAERRGGGEGLFYGFFRRGGLLSGPVGVIRGGEGRSSCFGFGVGRSLKKKKVRKG